jgi:hypothetical protein
MIYMKNNYTFLFKVLALLLVIGIIIAGLYKLQMKPPAAKTDSDSTALQSNQVDSTTVSVITQKYSNGVIKAEINAKGNNREGLTRNYHEDGSLMSEINYVNNAKDGISRDFYPNNKVRMEIMYQKGIMQGEAKWYYETGEVYRVTPYVKGKSEGIQKEYYKDGRIKAEIPHNSGVTIPGLKEYNIKGELLPMPSIVVSEMDKSITKGDFVLKIYLSNHSTNVKWYEGNLPDWTNFPKSLSVILSDSEGKGSIRFAAVPGSVVKKTIYIYAVATTEMGNQLVLKKKYDFTFTR